MAIGVASHRFTVDDYHAMATAGVLRDDDRIELIQGEIVDMAPVGPRHQGTVNFLSRWLTLGCGVRAIVQVQGPVRLGPGSEPQPDVLLLRPRDDFYRATPPGAADVLLLVEVADSSLTYDRTVKLPLYARAGIPEVWVVDLVRNEVTVHLDPAPDGYRRSKTLGRGGHLAPAAFPDVTTGVDDLLG